MTFLHLTQLKGILPLPFSPSLQAVDVFSVHVVHAKPRSTLSNMVEGTMSSLVLINITVIMALNGMYYVVSQNWLRTIN